MSRTQRSLRSGRLYAPLQTATGRGLRWRNADEARIRAALESPSADASLELRRYAAVSSLEALRWRWLGSPARHGWVASHGLRARGLAAPSALAYVESDGVGVREARLLLARGEDGGEPPDADALVRLALHARRDGVRHAAWDTEPFDTAALRQLDRIRFAPRRGGGAPKGLDAWVEARLADAPDALARYRAATSFQVLP